MFTLLLESPIAIAILGAFLALDAYLFCRFTGKRFLGTALSVVAGLTLVLFVVERMVETDRELVTATLAQMAVDLESNNVEAVLGHIHSSVPDVRTQAAMAMPAFTFEQVEILRLREIRVDGKGRNRTAVAEFNVTVTGRDNEGAVESGRVPRFVVLTLKPEAGAWRIVDLQDFEPQEGYLRNHRA